MTQRSLRTALLLALGTCWHRVWAFHPHMWVSKAGRYHDQASQVAFTTEVRVMSQAQEREASVPPPSRTSRDKTPTHTYSDSNDEVGEDGRPDATVFSIDRAVRLAAHAFAAYWNPQQLTWYRNGDGTMMGVPSPFCPQFFNGLLHIDVRRVRGLPGKIKKVGLEKVLGKLRKCDSYVTVEVQEQEGSNSVRTKVQNNNNNPSYDESFALHVVDPSRAKLRITVSDKNYNVVGQDAVVCTREVPLLELFGDNDTRAASGGDGKWLGWLDLPSAEGKPSQTCAEIGLKLTPFDGSICTEEATRHRHSDEDIGVEPHNLLEEVDWSELGRRAGRDSMGLDRFQLAFYLENKGTDTQSLVWHDQLNKEMIISFRGTGISVGNLVTDLSVLQTRMGGKADERRIHGGFWKAFRGISPTVQRAIDVITRGDVSQWTIELTGHSLGGVLAQLMAHDIAQRHPELAQRRRILMYSFGAPRAGNTAFAQSYDKLLHHTSFRIVNDLDVIARTPRAVRVGPLVLDYAHGGRPVLINTDTGDDKKGIWVEGENLDQAKIDGIGPFASTKFNHGVASVKVDEAKVAKYIGFSHSSYGYLLRLRRLQREQEGMATPFKRGV